MKLSRRSALKWAALAGGAASLAGCERIARSVSREDIIEGAQGLGVDLDAHIDFCVRAMQARAEELGLKGGV